MTPEGTVVSWGTTGDGAAWGPEGAEPIAFDEHLPVIAWHDEAEAATWSPADASTQSSPWRAVAWLPFERRGRRTLGLTEGDDE
jgi:hypothetical protein